MAQPVQYVLRDPFFISSRLMPAVNVADATIHMQARPYAVPEILRHFAARVDDALAAHPVAAGASGRARPFPRLDVTPAAEVSTGPAPVPAAARPRHPHTR